MSFLKTLFKSEPDPRETMRPLWERTVEIAREKPWYATHGVEDSVGGRFDVITFVLSLILIRLEEEDGFAPEMAWLTELFVDDMDGQLRELGINDVVVGKHMGKLMATLGGRIGTLRDGLSNEDESALADAVERNVQLLEGADPMVTAAALHVLYQQLRLIAPEAIIAGDIAR